MDPGVFQFIRRLGNPGLPAGARSTFFSLRPFMWRVFEYLIDHPDSYQPDWPDDWSDRRRVESVVLSAAQMHDPPWVADRADVNVVTARAAMEDLADANAAYLQSDQGFFWDEDRLETPDQLQTRSKDWLRDELEHWEAELDAFQAEHGVASPDSLDEPDEESEEESSIAQEWRHAKHHRGRIVAALQES